MFAAVRQIYLDKRSRQRARRAKRWQIPFRTRGDRAMAWWDMLTSDQGYFRMLYRNEHRLTDKVWRAGQPSPFTIRRWARRGIRTVVNLRGRTPFGTRPLEMEACADAGLAYEEFKLYSRRAPTPEMITGLVELFDRVEYPIVLHCQGGADRSGIAAALYLMVKEDRPVEEAMKQLSYRFGHVKSYKTGVLDQVLRDYRDARDTSGIGILEWVATEYDPDAITADFRENLWGRFLGDVILRRE